MLPRTRCCRRGGWHRCQSCFVQCGQRCAREKSESGCFAHSGCKGVLCRARATHTNFIPKPPKAGSNWAITFRPTRTRVSSVNNRIMAGPGGSQGAAQPSRPSSVSRRASVGIAPAQSDRELGPAGGSIGESVCRKPGCQSPTDFGRLKLELPGRRKLRQHRSFQPGYFIRWHHEFGRIPRWRKLCRRQRSSHVFGCRLPGRRGLSWWRWGRRWIPSLMKRTRAVKCGYSERFAQQANARGQRQQGIRPFLREIL